MNTIRSSKDTSPQSMDVGIQCTQMHDFYIVLKFAMAINLIQKCQHIHLFYTALLLRIY